MKFIPLAFALSTLAVLSGCNGGQKSSTGPQEVQLAVTDGGFMPSRAEVSRGQAFTLVVTRKTDQTCVKEIVIPALNVRRVLPLNQAVRIESRRA